MSQKTKALGKSKQVEKRKLTWAGSQSLMMGVAPGSKEARERELVRMVAAVLDVSPFGVNILGNVPYINKLGLTQKAWQYGNGKDKFEYEWVKVAQDDVEKSICKCRIVRDGNAITDWVLGECSPVTMKMGTLKGYQNHMSQTRARNRAILEAYGVRIHEEMLENIGKLLSAKGLTEKQASALTAVAGRATSSSTEEVEVEKGQKDAQIAPDLFRNPDQQDAVVSVPQDYACARKGCGNEISKAEFDYSKKVFGRPLCREHQKEAKSSRK